MNRTLMEAVRSMLSNARLPHRFWAEALSTATYLRNRSPTTAVDGITPFEAMTGNKPNVKHLRVFGCDAYAHIPKDERQKLDGKTRKCIFLGYGTVRKGYRLYEVDRAKVVWSRDVLFNECKHGVEKERDENCDKQYVKLDSTDDDQVNEVVDHDDEPVLRRSSRERKPPTHYGEWANLTHGDFEEPETVKEALASVDKSKWQEAMEKELDSLHANEVWDLVEPPEHRKTVGSKWVFKVKVSADGQVERHKAQLVVQGYTQRYGFDYDETFCPVVRSELVRTVIALAAHSELKLHQMDVTTVFLNGTLKEVYMKQPEGFAEKGKEHLVCRLRKSIYGLKLTMFVAGGQETRATLYDLSSTRIISIIKKKQS